jgi:acyl-CoA synthetase (AMP-forming)/AMP-acid ligase II
MSLTDLLIHHADRFPDRLALEFEGRTTTWGELLEGTRATAAALAAAGVKRGDVVGVLLHNSDRIIEVMHAISHVGAIFMPLNWRLAGAELAYILSHSGAGALISEPALEPLLEPVESEVTCRRLRIGTGSSEQRTDLDELRRGLEPLVGHAPLAPDDVHRLMYTSGTTSRPKGVMITYANLEAKNVSHIVELGMTAGDVNLVCGPLYHVGGLDLTTTTMMFLGAESHILRRFEPASVLEAIERHGATHTWMAPVMINQVLAEPTLDQRDLSSLRVIIDGGEKMPMPLIKRVVEMFPNAWFADAYGLTETVSGDTFLDKARMTDKLGSVGKPVVHMEVRIAGPDGELLPAGQPGEVLLRGPKVCKGYWRNEEATAEAMRDDWFHTGDVGVLDEDGFLYIVDRLKDMIVSGGENVASSEVERVLYEHDAVHEAAVVARPHPRWHEVPVAYVVLGDRRRASEAELAEHCRGRLARFKVPAAFRIVDALPRNPSGKVLKRELRDGELELYEQSADLGAG